MRLPFDITRSGARGSNPGCRRTLRSTSSGFRSPRGCERSLAGFVSSMRLRTVVILGLMFALAAILTGCTSHEDSQPQDAQADVALAPDTLACLDAGNECMSVEHAGCGAGTTVVGTCGTGFYCCASHQFNCGDRLCTFGNTCDTAVKDYCAGSQNIANCGDYACLGGCSCYSGPGGCLCPRCQRATQQTGPLGNICPGTGVLYNCYLPMLADSGSADFPPDAGACTLDNGELCCEH